MQLAPDPTLLFAVLVYFPLAFTKYFQTGRADNQVGDLALGWLSVSHLEQVDTLADASGFERMLRYIYQHKQRVEQALGHD